VIALAFAVVGILPTVAHSAEPAPVTDVQAVNFLENYFNQVFLDVSWTPSADTAEALVCWQMGNEAPSTPGEGECTTPREYGAQPFERLSVEPDTTYGVSVFSYVPSLSLPGASASTIVTTTHPLPPPLSEHPGVWTMASSPESVTLRWMGNAFDDDAGEQWNISAYVVTLADGDAAPGPAAEPLAALPLDVPKYEIDGLEPGKVYTASVAYQDPQGDRGAPASVTFTTRVAGIRTTSRASDGSVTSAVPASTGNPAVADYDVTPGGTQNVVYAQGPSVLFVSQEPGQAWTTPVTLGTYPSGMYARHLFIARSGAGALVAGWDSGNVVRYRVRPPGAGWRPAVALAGTRSRGADLLGIDFDASGHLHVLLQNVSHQSWDLIYRTNATGAWSSSQIGAVGYPDAASLTVDRATGRVIVVDAHNAGSGVARISLRIAAASARSTSLGRWHLLRTYNADSDRFVSVVPVVAAKGGVVTVGVSAGGSHLAASAAGVFVMSGERIVALSDYHAVTGSAGTSGDLALHAVSRNRVLLAWTNHPPIWGSESLGLYWSSRSHSAAGWRETSPVHRTQSPYDLPAGVGRDGAGHVYLGWMTVNCDRCSPGWSFPL